MTSYCLLIVTNIILNQILRLNIDSQMTYRRYCLPVTQSTSDRDRRPKVDWLSTLCRLLLVSVVDFVPPGGGGGGGAMANNGEKWRKMAMANSAFSFVKFAIFRQFLILEFQI